MDAITDTDHQHRVYAHGDRDQSIEGYDVPMSGRDSAAARDAIRQMTANLRTLPRVAKVLIVDDSEEDIMVLRKALWRIDPAMHIDSANGAAKAEALCANEKYDLIFLDLLFHGEDGSQMLRSGWAQSGTHVIVLTGADVRSIPVEHARQAGAKIILTKPVNSHVLDLIFRTVPNPNGTQK